MNNVKALTAVATALVIAAQPVSAGNMTAPIMEEDPIVEEAAASNGGIIVPIIFLLLLAAALGGGGSSPSPQVVDTAG